MAKTELIITLKRLNVEMEVYIQIYSPFLVTKKYKLCEIYFITWGRSTKK